ncbi:MAG: hypothetical protein COA47_12060 [Robiginitomaculum sp.]|nr:MAG: hypothetical protein COA47_12060 [Robiginitomaculum sp.]
MKALICTLGASIVLAGCASIDGDYWSRQGVSQFSLDGDARVCAGEAKEVGGFGRGGSRRDHFQNCMQQKGYVLRDFTDDQIVEMDTMNAQRQANYQHALMAEAKMGRRVIFIPTDPTLPY